MKQTKQTTNICESALNSAGWEFINAYREIMSEPETAELFNNIKPILKESIREYLSKNAVKVKEAQQTCPSCNRPLNWPKPTWELAFKTPTGYHRVATYNIFKACNSFAKFLARKAKQTVRVKRV